MTEGFSLSPKRREEVWAVSSHSPNATKFPSPLVQGGPHARLDSGPSQFAGGFVPHTQQVNLRIVSQPD